MNRELDASMRLKLVGTASEISAARTTRWQAIEQSARRTVDQGQKSSLWLPNMFPDTLASRQHMAEITSSYVVDFS